MVRQVDLAPTAASSYSAGLGHQPPRGHQSQLRRPVLRDVGDVWCPGGGCQGPEQFAGRIRTSGDPAFAARRVRRDAGLSGQARAPVDGQQERVLQRCRGGDAGLSALAGPGRAASTARPRSVARRGDRDIAWRGSVADRWANRYPTGSRAWVDGPVSAFSRPDSHFVVLPDSPGGRVDSRRLGKCCRELAQAPVRPPVGGGQLGRRRRDGRIGPGYPGGTDWLLPGHGCRTGRGSRPGQRRESPRPVGVQVGRFLSPDRVRRRQGSRPGRRLGGPPVVLCPDAWRGRGADRADTLAQLLGTGVDEEALAVRLMQYIPHPLAGRSVGLA